MATFFNQATLSYNGNSVNSNVVSAELLEALEVTKTNIGDGFSANNTSTYSISIVNTGDTDITDVTVTDNLGEYPFGTGETRTPLTYENGSAYLFSDGTPVGAPAVTAGPPLVFSGITVPANGNVLIIYNATPNEFAPTTVGGQIVNNATVTSPSIAEAVTAQATSLALDEPNLTISKAVSPATVNENGQITYTFIIENNGNTAATTTDGAVVTDTFNPVLSNLAVTYNGVPWATPTNYTYNEATGEFATVAGEITVPAATAVQDPTTGAYTITPGRSTLTVTGTV